MNDVQDIQNKDKKKQRLELTWIGKDEQLKLEPRILIEDPEKSYGDSNTENMLIHGDNLLALKALEQDFAGKIKCIYIDPPYNTGSRINSDGSDVGYDDGLEHSEWLNMMKPRLEIIKKLLDKNGTLAIQIDDHEFARLYLLLVDIFGEQNLKTICVKMSEATGVKMTHAINAGRIPKLKEYIIIARKNGIRDLFVGKIPKEKWDNEYKHLVDGVTTEEIHLLKSIIANEIHSEEDIINADLICSKFTLKPVDTLFNNQSLSPEQQEEIKHQNSWRIVRDVATSDSAKAIADKKRLVTSNNYFTIVTNNNKMYVIKKGYNPQAPQPRIKLLFADDYLDIHPGDFWSDIKTTGLDNEGGVKFAKGKKPELLLKRIIEMSSVKGDYVLDSFAGSGTTGAVSHKLNRKWILVELAEHAFTHIIPRLRRVVDGDDEQGISAVVGWKGGGGFKFYNLAPSLLKKDKFGHWIVDEKYNPNMLAAAMCKHEGFKYNPDSDVYWKHGKSTESDYIFVTTNFISLEQLDSIHSEMLEGESLLICTKSFSPDCESKYGNMTIKKIPQAILGSCEFSKDNYDLNIIKSTEDIAEEQDEEVSEDE